MQYSAMQYNAIMQCKDESKSIFPPGLDLHRAITVKEGETQSMFFLLFWNSCKVLSNRKVVEICFDIC